MLCLLMLTLALKDRAFADMYLGLYTQKNTQTYYTSVFAIFFAEFWILCIRWNTRKNENCKVLIGELLPERLMENRVAAAENSESSHALTLGFSLSPSFSLFFRSVIPAPGITFQMLPAPKSPCLALLPEKRSLMPPTQVNTTFDFGIRMH